MPEAGIVFVATGQHRYPRIALVAVRRDNVDSTACRNLTGAPVIGEPLWLFPMIRQGMLPRNPLLVRRCDGVGCE